jgi:hypothetical protein
MISSGASIKAVLSQLGHATATMTLDGYGHLYADELEALSGGSRTASVRRSSIGAQWRSTLPRR